ALNVQRGLDSAPPSLSQQWFALGLSSQLRPDSLLATRLLGEPLVLYRDSAQRVVCLKDVCPHRSAPLSMGTVEEGTLRCFYHGWGFGAGGECTDVPTQRQGSGDKEGKGGRLRGFCAGGYPVVEEDGLIWVWRGESERSSLPSRPERAGEIAFTCDTTLDFACEWHQLVEKSLDSPHLYWLNDGWIPPLAAFGFIQGRPSPQWKSTVPEHSLHSHPRDQL
ncbi:MAG: hypothetical protein SGPRY_013394, partial [Prymnesium sp.]